MGTWDIGPFGNDTAADFSYTLDETPPGERENLIRTTLARTVRSRDYLESPEAVEAVAAAALVAAQCPGGEPITTSYGPDKALPRLATDLRALAAEALGRVLAADSELAELWDDSGEGPQWRQGIGHLRAVLDPRPGSQEGPAVPGPTC
ncbi:DUF4259 domain-containing protein [Kitasatospora indigofera]|uniref:DUF4259 domain-containing protein n=1 Tax=Kitasatospora indigofera TaxID=67307 RepID=UPI003699863C